jgi:ankyrin repeat protein
MTDLSKVNPYIGLKPFSYNNSEYFFGRDMDTSDILEKIAQHPLISIIGFSGSGKSSIVFADVLMKLYGGFITGAKKGWQVAIFNPGENPNLNLYKSLLVTKWGRESLTGKYFEDKFLSGELDLKSLFFLHPLDKEERLLIVVDQFEEIFKDENLLDKYNEIQNFIDNLIQITPESENSFDIPSYRVNVIFTMRVDFMSKLIHFSGLPEAFSKGIYFIPPMNKDGLEEAIIGPANIVGKEFAPELVKLLIKKCNDIRTSKRKNNYKLNNTEEDDTLPLLQFFLMLLWNKFSKRKKFTIDHYLKIGPLDKVLDKHLNEVYYFKLTPRQRKLTKFLFSTLSKIDRDNHKRVIRNPQKQTIKMIAKLYKQLNKSKTNLNVITREFIEVSQVFLHEEIKVLKILNHKKGKKIIGNSKIDVMHEAIFRNWYLCEIWTNEESEKEELFYKICNETEKIGLFWNYAKIKETINHLKYFEDSDWLFSKGINESKIGNSNIEKIKRLYFKNAIKELDWYRLYGILNNKENEKLSLWNEDLNDTKFKKEFYYALSFNDYDYKDAESRWVEQKISFTDYIMVGEHSKFNVSHFAAFVGNERYLNAIEKYQKKVKGSDLFNLKSDNEPDTFGSAAIYGGQFKLAKSIYKSLESDSDRINVLYKKGRDSGRIPLHYAAMMGHVEIFKWLIQKHEGVISTIEFKYKKTSKELMLIKKNKNEYEAKTRDVKKLEKRKKDLKKRIEFKYYTNDNGDNILHHATYNHDPRMVSEILKLGFNQRATNIFGETPLHFACAFKNFKVIEELLKKLLETSNLRKVVNNKKQTILHHVILDAPEFLDKDKLSSKLVILRKLLSYKDLIEIINYKDSDGMTALYYAILFQDFNLVKLLLDKGAKTNTPDAKKNTVFHIAARNQNSAILTLVLKSSKKKFKRHADFVRYINKRNGNYKTAAELAYQQGNFENLNNLLQENINFIPPLGHDYNPIEQKKVKWDDNRINEEIIRYFDSKYNWMVPLIYSSNLWVKRSNNFVIKCYEESSSLKEKNLNRILSIRSCKLPFYPNSILCEMKVKGFHKNQSLVFVKYNDEVMVLDGNSYKIHEWNKKHPIDLNTGNVSKYLDFFCSMIHGDEGAFKIINSSENVDWLDKRQKIKAKKFIQFVINTYSTPPKRDKESNSWSIRKLVNYGNSMFISNFIIKSNGIVDMLDDIPIYMNLSINIPVFRSSLLIFKGTSSDSKKNKLERVSFTLAAKYGLLELMKWMKKNDSKLNINMLNDDNKTALVIAIENKFYEAVEWLLKQKGIKKE